MSCVERHTSFQSLISFQMDPNGSTMFYPTRDLVDLLLLNSHSVCATLRIWAAHPGFSPPPGWYKTSTGSKVIWASAQEDWKSCNSEVSKNSGRQTTRPACPFMSIFRRKPIGLVSLIFRHAQIALSHVPPHCTFTHHSILLRPACIIDQQKHGDFIMVHQQTVLCGHMISELRSNLLQ